MKRLFTILLAALMVFALVSCGSGGAVTRGKTLTLGDYVIEFAGYELTKDSLGGDAVLITYNFTNNSDEACAFTDSAYYEVLQGEESLNSTTIYVSEESMDTITKNEYEEIEPGATIEVVVAYELEDTSSPVTVNFMGFGDDSDASHTINISSASAAGTSFTDDEEDEEYADDENEDLLIDSFGIADSKWYGWWELTDATGDYEEYDGEYYDCCAIFEPSDDGYVLMSIWDEEYSDYESNCLSELYLEEYGDMGYASVSGYFLTGDDIGADGNVVVIPDALGIEHALAIAIPVETENGGFTAELYLAEWGYEWDEMISDYPTYYDSYFVPLMEDGEDLPTNLDDIG